MRMEAKNIAAHAPLLTVGLGELIWDLLPGGKQLGGAPTNFAYISRLLGNASAVASRIGADELGVEASERLARLGISTAHLQVDDAHPTGTVRVELDAQGEAHFAINENSAWDYLEWTPAWAELAEQTQVVGFGTLGQRVAASRTAINKFLETTRPAALRVFDVNLRHSFFNVEMLERSLALATIVKLNREELFTLATMLKLVETTETEIARQIIRRFQLELVAITRGQHGSLLVTGAATDEHAGVEARVADTIGAGDAFIATLAHFYQRRAPLPVISEAANRMAAWVASQSGATPAFSPEVRAQILAVGVEG